MARASADTISHKETPITVTLSMASQAQVEAPNLEERQCLVVPMKSSQLSLVLALQVQEAKVLLFGPVPNAASHGTG